MFRLETIDKKLNELHEKDNLTKEYIKLLNTKFRFVFVLMGLLISLDAIIFATMLFISTKI